MNDIVKFKSDSGQDVTITPQDVKNVLCQSATDKEVAMFLALCQAQRLNPWIKEAYLVKYGSSPATIITGKDVFTRRAAKNSNYQGFEAGVTVLHGGKIERREGSAVFDGEKLIGGWARVFVEGRKPHYDEISLKEYSTGKSGWAKMPGTMIRKVALVHALREAYPSDFSGLYSQEEMDQAIEGTAEIVSSHDVAKPIEPAVEAAPEPDEATKNAYRAAYMGAIKAGVKKSGIDSWFMSRYGHEMMGLTPKEMAETTEYLNGRIADMRELGNAEYELADEDIEF